MKQLKLTSVKLFDDLYKSFKKNTIDNGFTLQKLVNRSIHHYIKDSNFKDKLECTVSGSSYSI